MRSGDREPGPAGDGVDKGGALVRVILVIGVLLAAGEVAARAFLTSPSGQIGDPELGWVWRPGAEIFNGSEGGARLVINDHGLNDDPIAAVAPGRRVLVLGNSFTEALQVPRDHNFTTLCEGAGLDVVNAARSAMGPAHYPVVADRLAADVAPAAIVVALGAGDAGHVLGPTVAVSRRSDGALTEVALVPETKDALKAAFEPLLSRSALAVYLMRRYKPVVMGWLEAFRGQAAAAAAPGVELDLADARDRITFVLRRLAAHAPVVVLDIPELGYRPARVAERVAPKVTAVYRAAAEAAGARWIDAGPELIAAYRASGRPGHGFANVKLGYGHLNEDGHAAVARALVPPLVALFAEEGS